MQRLCMIAILLILPLFVTGFSLDNASVPQADILSGSPPKDGIPALLEPKFVDAVDADFLNPKDPVIGVVLSGQAKAYPIKILNWHEVLNDTLGDAPIPFRLSYQKTGRSWMYWIIKPDRFQSSSPTGLPGRHFTRKPCYTRKPDSRCPPEIISSA